ncbi:PREDICTED: LOW QUALITY PROTEIN: disease resistance protein LAZ5-like [Tarenaya hassleriana]|uniref:LOW QUALITY PROTEIN: disease resistance protein LAZ5-like n=1 Tax=Tarenaya hassleriana TaxID=28532 RepID=UPI0008FD0D0A|nr:PREDICTED: LOW QUALITY PROTEIN: disease resistance protein LAZ5-like [Tarenaya hassleriana]
MASSSSSSSSSPDPSRRQYDVFLSFRGADTRRGLISFLYEFLGRKGIDAFIDEKLRRGDNLLALLGRIEQSKMSIVVFSENYADSDWCLEELSKIMKCHESFGQEVLPVFYKVSASDVRNQEGKFGARFETPSASFGEKQDRVPQWKQALKDAANIAGRVELDNRTERDLVDKITKETLKMLNKVSPCDIRNLPGIEPRAQELENLLLSQEINRVRIVGVVGMAGIGKKTVARCVYHCNFPSFDGHYFLEDIRNESKLQGLRSLRQNLLRGLLDDENLDTGVSDGANEANRLRNKKLFIVLDDVTSRKQITELIGEPERYKDTYHGGSWIVITSRDQKLLKGIVDVTYIVPKLNDKEAFQLFSSKAFPKCSCPEELRDLANKFVDYADGNPLALQVLGSDLLRRDETYWRKKFAQLQTSTDAEIEDMLKSSFVDLSPEHKNMFLDIACLFISEETDFVSSILNADHYDAAAAISDLKGKCLLTISNNRLQMHDLLHTMGKKICTMSPIKGADNCSRLWNHKDIDRVLKKRIGGIKNIRGIFQDLAKLRAMEISPDVFTKMRELKFLKFYNSHCSKGCENECKLRFKQGLDCLPDELVYLNWQGFPLEYLPSNFNPGNLIDLKLCYSRIKQLWEDEKSTEKLKWVDLSHSKDLLNLSGLSEAQNLQRLNLEGCTSLTKLFSATPEMNSLCFLNLRGCTNFESLPEGDGLKSLKTLILSGCSKLHEFRTVSENLEYLYLDGTSIERVPESIGSLHKLLLLNLRNCKRLKHLPSTLQELKSLEELIISGCKNLESFPAIENSMERLEILLMDNTTIQYSPKKLSLRNLKVFSFCGSNVQDPEHLISQLFSSGACLSDLYLTDCNLHKLPGILSFSWSLQNLCLCQNKFGTLPESIQRLYHLKSLDLKYCQMLKSLPVLPSNLQYLDAHGCTSLETVTTPMTLLPVSERKHPVFIFTDCFKLTQDAQENILAHAQFKSQLLATSSLQHNHEGVVLEPLVEVCFPGWDMPLWFPYRTRGSSMEIDLPPHWCNNQFLGISLCTVISFKDYKDQRSGFRVRCRCNIKGRDDNCVNFSFYLRGWNEQCCRSSGHGTRKLGSDHVFISYNNDIPVQKFREEDNNSSACGHTKATLEFSVTDDSERKLECCDVVKCGMSLLYISDEIDCRFQKIKEKHLEQTLESEIKEKNFDRVTSKGESRLTEHATDETGVPNGDGLEEQRTESSHVKSRSRMNPDKGLPRGTSFVTTQSHCVTRACVVAPTESPEF